MARCNDCNKFVGLEMPDPEVGNVEVTDEREDGATKGTVRVKWDVRIARECADCGSELKEATLDMEADLEVDHTRTTEGADGGEDEEHELEAEEEDVEATERTDGKPGTPSRYRRSFYGAHVTVRVKCSCGEDLGTVEGSDDVQASSMDDC